MVVRARRRRRFISVRIVSDFRLVQWRGIVSRPPEIFIQQPQQSLEMLRRYYQYGINKQEPGTACLPCIKRMSWTKQDKLRNCAWRPAHHRSKLSCASLKYSSGSSTTVQLLLYCAVKSYLRWAVGNRWLWSRGWGGITWSGVCVV